MAVEDPRSMLDRLTRLERSNRRWKRGTILAACAAILVVGAFAGILHGGPGAAHGLRAALRAPEPER